MTIFDLEQAGWLHQVGDKPWAVAPDPPMGDTVLTLDDIPPGLEDGTPVYVEQIEWPDGTPPSGGWVVIYDGIPHPVLVPEVVTVVHWVNTYGWVPGIPAGTDGGELVTGGPDGAELVAADPCAHSLGRLYLRGGSSLNEFAVLPTVDIGAVT